jgi:hypothetical protein
MIKYYNDLPIIQKIRFTTGPVYRCSRIPEFRQFFFYKFVYDFWFHRVQGAKGKSPNLYKNITNFDIPTTYGGYPAHEREIILDGLGIPYAVNRTIPKGVPVYINRNKYTDKGIMSDVHIAAPEHNGYKLDNALITMYQTLAKPGHAIAGIITPEGEYMIIDSNNKSFKHNWAKDLNGILLYYPNYKIVTYTSIMYIDQRNLPDVDKAVFRQRPPPPRISPPPLNVNSKDGSRQRPPSPRISPPLKVNSKDGSRQRPPSPRISPPLNVNSKGRKIYTGMKGGKYILIGTRKQYIKKTTTIITQTNINSKGRKIHTGSRGGRYVLEGTRKIYLKKAAA